MPTTSMPVFWIVRIAVSRPEPGPLTTQSTLRTPCSIARRAAVSAASCAANGVDLRDPLNPTLPAEAHAITLPCWSEMVMIVLLNDDLMCAIPYATFLRSRRFGRRPPAVGLATLLARSLRLRCVFGSREHSVRSLCELPALASLALVAASRRAGYVRRVTRVARSSSLLAGALLAGDGLLRALAGARVRPGALAADGQAPAVPDSLVGPDLHLALDVC